MRQRFLFLLCLLLPTLSFAQTAASAGFVPQQGVDYQVITQGQPYQPLNGKIEVAEIFGYWCIHCAHFEPELTRWKGTLPGDVRVTYVPAVFQDNDPFARAYFAAEQMKALTRTHAAMFNAVHQQQTLAQNASIEEIASFYATLGLNAEKMKTAMLLPGVEKQLAHAKSFAMASGISGTPSLIVNGKYRVEGRNAREQLRIAEALIAMERKAKH